MKKCSKCKEEKETSLFRKDKRNKEGLQSHCISCQKQYNNNWKTSSSFYTNHWYQGQKTKTELDSFVIQEAMELKKMREKATKIKWEIDHIIPIKHSLCCGLHNAFNIQVVPSLWNSKKGNRNMNSLFPVK